MKRITHLTGISLLLAVTVLAHPWQKSDFSGTWVLDKDKSFSNGAGFDQTMTITHKNDAFKIEAKQKTARGEQAITEEFTLDGKVSEYNPPQPPNARGKRTASWLPNGRTILVSDEVSADGKVIRQVIQTVCRAIADTRNDHLGLFTLSSMPRGFIATISTGSSSGRPTWARSPRWDWATASRRCFTKEGRRGRLSWATPLLVNAGSHTELIASGAETIVSYDPATGKEIWRCDGVGCMGIKLGGSGNLTGTPFVAWSHDKGTAYVTSPILYED